ncbi:MAG: 50S ribosomal protein L15 [Acidobacteria bacterium]|nr:50S ribosomal protein L15 [Acidobacteriota bacterium]
MGIGLHNLKRNAGANRPSKRRGQGPGSGNGKTAGRGYKGQRSRSGYSHKIGFEGGQMPLYRRLPKVGFTNIFKKEYAIINLAALNRFDAGTVVTPELLAEAGLIRNLKHDVKVLGNGKIQKKLTVRAHKFSRTAAESIAAAGGKVEVING